MLKPKQIDELPESLIELYSQVEMDIIADMARRISGMDYFIPAAEWQYRKLIEMGNCHGWIMQALSAQTGKTRAEIERMMDEAGAKAIRQDAAIYKRAGLSPPELAASPSLQAVLNDGIQRTEGLFENLTGTTANTVSRQFERALDRAWLQVQSGAFSQEEAIRGAVKDLAEKGVESIAYPSGYVDHMDVAVRRAAVTGANQAALRLQDALADEMGSDLVEVTAHAGARPEHAAWQGKVYSRSGNSRKYPPLVESTGYGSGAGLGGWNCRHNVFPFFDGISDPAYTKTELKDMDEPKYTYNGEKLTEYEASQKQRAIERNIRRWKREYTAMEAAGLDTSEAAAKLSRWQKTQKDFISQTGLKRQADREWVPKPTKADVRYRAAVGREPVVTRDVTAIAKSMGVDTDGLEYRIKSRPSYMRKVQSRGQEYEVKDILRYTYTTKADSLAEKTLSCLDAYKAEGYTVLEVKNTWKSRSNPYRGINTVIQSPDGQVFELQFHTPESFALKNGELHRLYEKQRLIVDRRSDEYLRLQDEMFRLSGKLEIPKDIERVK